MTEEAASSGIAEIEEPLPSVDDRFMIETSMDSLLETEVAKNTSSDSDGETKGFALRAISEGEVVTGRIIKVGKQEVVVDIGYKCEGILPLADLGVDPATIVEGQEVEVAIDGMHDEEGVVILSRKNVERKRTLLRAQQAMENEEVIVGKITRKVKGGLRADLGFLEAFLPGSQIDLKRVSDFDEYLGKDLDLRVLKVNMARANVIVSRRKVLESRRQADRAKAVTRLKVGDVVKGEVKNLTHYGAFVDVGGIDGLLHVTDISWDRVGHPSEILKPGQEVEVKIIEMDSDNQRVSLGMKQITPDPWEILGTTLEEGKVLDGTVSNLTNYGAFVRIAEGIEGLVHISEMSWTRRLKHPSELLTEGDKVQVKVLGLDRKNRKVKLGLKQTTKNPWSEVEEKYHVGDVLEGTVRSLADFGAFVTLEDGVDGLLHVKDMSWSGKLKAAGMVVNAGDKIQVKILAVDKEFRKISLGLKQLGPDPWDGVEGRLHVGQRLTGKVVNLTNFGAFVEIEEEVAGLLHISEMGLEASAILKDHLNVGDLATVEILRVDEHGKRIALSQKGIPEGERIMPAAESEKSEDSQEVPTKDPAESPAAEATAESSEAKPEPAEAKVVDEKEEVKEKADVDPAQTPAPNPDQTENTNSEDEEKARSPETTPPPAEQG